MKNNHFRKMRSITPNELSRNDGERGPREYIAYRGIVYDVTGGPKWRTRLHELLHFPGQDLPLEFPDAPYREEVFQNECVKTVGRRASNERWKCERWSGSTKRRSAPSKSIPC